MSLMDLVTAETKTENPGVPPYHTWVCSPGRPAQLPDELILHTTGNLKCREPDSATSNIRSARSQARPSSSRLEITLCHPSERSVPSEHVIVAATEPASAGLNYPEESCLQFVSNTTNARVNRLAIGTLHREQLKESKDRHGLSLPSSTDLLEQRRTESVELVMHRGVLDRFAGCREAGSPPALP